MLDAHNHLHFEDFDDDRDAVLERARESGVRGMILAGYDSQRRSIAARLATRPGVWATAGLHPWAVAEADDERVQAELDLLDGLQWGRWTALGELGIDRHVSDSDEALARQFRVFREQLALARTHDVPVVIHSVRANQDVLRWLQKDGAPGRGGIIHSFWGSVEEARRFVDAGFALSIGTQLTHSNPKKMTDALRDVGLAHLLVETDAPARPPASVEAERNEPAFLGCVVDALALTLGTSARKVADRTEENARQLFDLPAQEELQ